MAEQTTTNTTPNTKTEENTPMITLLPEAGGLAALSSEADLYARAALTPIGSPLGGVGVDSRVYPTLPTPTLTHTNNTQTTNNDQTNRQQSHTTTTNTNNAPITPTATTTATTTTVSRKHPRQPDDESDSPYPHTSSSSASHPTILTAPTLTAPIFSADLTPFLPKKDDAMDVSTSDGSNPVSTVPAAAGVVAPPPPKSELKIELNSIDASGSVSHTVGGGAIHDANSDIGDEDDEDEDDELYQPGGGTTSTQSKRHATHQHAPSTNAIVSGGGTPTAATNVGSGAASTTDVSPSSPHTPPPPQLLALQANNFHAHHHMMAAHHGLLPGGIGGVGSGMPPHPHTLFSAPQLHHLGLLGVAPSVAVAHGAGGGLMLDSPSPTHLPHTHLHDMDDSKNGGGSCHQCKTARSRTQLLICTRMGDRSRKRRCRKKFCHACLLRSYNLNALTMKMEEVDSWLCPACNNTCICAACGRRQVNSAAAAASVTNGVSGTNTLSPTHTPNGGMMMGGVGGINMSIGGGGGGGIMTPLVGGTNNGKMASNSGGVNSQPTTPMKLQKQNSNTNNNNNSNTAAAAAAAAAAATMFGGVGGMILPPSGGLMGGSWGAAGGGAGAAYLTPPQSHLGMPNMMGLPRAVSAHVAGVKPIHSSGIPSTPPNPFTFTPTPMQHQQQQHQHQQQSRSNLGGNMGLMSMNLPFVPNQPTQTQPSQQNMMPYLPPVNIMLPTTQQQQQQQQPTQQQQQQQSLPPQSQSPYGVPLQLPPVGSVGGGGVMLPPVGLLPVQPSFGPRGGANRLASAPAAMLSATPIGSGNNYPPPHLSQHTLAQAAAFAGFNPPTSNPTNHVNVVQPTSSSNGFITPTPPTPSLAINTSFNNTPSSSVNGSPYPTPNNNTSTISTFPTSSPNLPSSTTSLTVPPMSITSSSSPSSSSSPLNSHPSKSQKLSHGLPGLSNDVHSSGQISVPTTPTLAPASATTTLTTAAPSAVVSVSTPMSLTNNSTLAPTSTNAMAHQPQPLTTLATMQGVSTPIVSSVTATQSPPALHTADNDAADALAFLAAAASTPTVANTGVPSIASQPQPTQVTTTSMHVQATTTLQPATLPPNAAQSMAAQHQHQQHQYQQQHQQQAQQQAQQHHHHQHAQHMQQQQHLQQQHAQQHQHYGMGYPNMSHMSLPNLGMGPPLHPPQGYYGQQAMQPYGGMYDYSQSQAQVQQPYPNAPYPTQWTPQVAAHQQQHQQQQQHMQLQSQLQQSNPMQLQAPMSMQPSMQAMSMPVQSYVPPPPSVQPSGGVLFGATAMAQQQQVPMQPTAASATNVVIPTARRGFAPPFKQAGTN